MGAIQPRVLTWARETAGLPLEAAARALGLNPARGKTGAERLAAIEAGAEDPSRQVLLSMAKAYRRPLVAFYLAAPPPAGDRGQDFRTLPGHKRHHPDVDALLRDIKARQGLIHSMLEDDDAGPVDFIGAAATNFSVSVLANLISRRIAFSLAEFRASRSMDEAFTYLRSRIEEAGVFVLLLGNLGSHHTNIRVELFRGFALADPIAPLIVINDQDARAAWSFTALHELVHLWLGHTGISGTDGDNRIEEFCNDVAAEILLPAHEALSFAGTTAPNASEFAQVVAAITSFADARRVSRPMAAYRLLRAGRLSKPLWTELRTYFAKQWEQHQQHEAEAKDRQEGGPSYYVVRRHRVGPALLGLVRRSLDQGTVTYTKAGRVLGVKPRNVEPLLSTVRGTR